METVANPTHRYYEFTMQMKLVSGTWAKDKFAFGGALLKGSHPKKKRCFRPSLPLHIVMRSSRARGKQSLFAYNPQIAGIVAEQAKRQFVRVYAAANAGNHLHLLIDAPSQAHLSNFLRALTGRTAQLVGGVKGFWDARPFSRVVSWGRDFKSVLRYIGINSTETIGMSRASVRAMFERIRLALSEGRLAKTPSLVAAGFV